MRWSRPVFAVTAAVVVLLFTASALRAQVARSGGGVNSQMVAQLQQLASEKTRMEAENAKLKKDLEDAHKELESLKNAQKALDERAKGSAAALVQDKTQRDAAEEQLKQTKDKMAELIAKFRETAQHLRDAETDRAATKQTLATRDQQLHACVDHNLALYKLNNEALTYIDKQGFWSRVAAAEPFTKLKRIQNENLVDDYKARADDQRVAPPAPTALPSTPPAAPPASPN
jgi:chromosome segregation ATPase